MTRRAGFVFVAMIVGAACSSGAPRGDGLKVGASEPSSPSVSSVPQTSWSVFSLPAGFKERDGQVYAQIDDTHALVYGGSSIENGEPIERNDGEVVDLVSGAMWNLQGPSVHGGLTRASAATESGSARVAIAGLQCVSPSEDAKYRRDDDSTVDACSPGPVTVAVYDEAKGSWSRPSDAPFDYGQAFLPKIIGYVDGRVYIWVNVFGSARSARDAYISYDVATGDWTRITAPPAPVLACLGESKVVGLVYDGVDRYSNPRVVTYDPTHDAWSSHPVPEMTSSPYPYERSCTEHAVVINDNRPGHPNLYYAYSLVDGRWTQLPAPPVNQLLGALRASAGDTLVTWNVGYTEDPSPASIAVGTDSKWTPRPAMPTVEDDSADINYAPQAHIGTHIVSFYKGAVMSADLAHLGDQ